MARKPLMHNYIYFETLEVGSGRISGSCMGPCLATHMAPAKRPLKAALDGAYGRADARSRRREERLRCGRPTSLLAAAAAAIA